MNAEAGTLDEAWAEVEALGAHPSLHPHWGEAPDSEPLPLLGYRATTWVDDRHFDTYADSPAAALHALAAALRAVPA